jgi:hypothetical protein
MKDLKKMLHPNNRDLLRRLLPSSNRIDRHLTHFGRFVEYEVVVTSLTDVTAITKKKLKNDSFFKIIRERDDAFPCFLFQSAKAERWRECLLWREGDLISQFCASIADQSKGFIFRFRIYLQALFFDACF